MSKNDIDDTEDKNKQKKTMYYLKEDKPKDLVTIFLDNLDKLSKTESSYEEYKLLRTNINIGKIILNKQEHNHLKQEITNFLKSDNTYLTNRDIELQDMGRYYKCGGPNSGNVYVKPDELEIGTKDAINQECDKKLPGLIEMHDKLFEAIVEEGWIKREVPEIDDMLDDIIRQEINIIYNKEKGDKKDVIQ